MFLFFAFGDACYRALEGKALQIRQQEFVLSMQSPIRKS
jgi:hypothetical protein